MDTKVAQTDHSDGLLARFGAIVSSRYFPPALFAALTGAMFFDVLFSAGRVVSAASTDLAMQFIPWREFGFAQLRAGNLPLWNPHIYGGAPYFAGFQSALLYPPNWLHLILPVGVAINWIVAIHVFCAGYVTHLWCRARQCSAAGSIIAGVMFMFSGPYFLHLYAGHLPHLAVMAWLPLMLLVIDQLAETGSMRWALAGAFICAMHILSGHPQYVYYTGIGLTLYVAIRAARSKHRLRLAAGFFAMYVGAVGLTAIQLLPGVEAARESVRAGGTSFEFASTFSLPPQNLITLLVPAFFGNVPLREAPGVPGYWGAGYLWEMSLFVSISGLVLAVLGMLRAPRSASVPAIIMILAMLLLALGRHTPLYRPMFELLPGYSSFRGTVKFAYLAVPFVGLLAAIGFDSLRLETRPRWAVIGPLAGVTLALVLMGSLIWISASRGTAGKWAGFVKWMADSAVRSHEWFAGLVPTDAAFIERSGRQAAMHTYIAAGVLLISALFVLGASYRRWLGYSLILVCAIEMFVIARLTRATMDPSQAVAVPPAWQQALRDLPADQRVLTIPIEMANLGMSVGFDNLAGYDPGVFKRYAELIFASQGEDAAKANQYLPFRRPVRSVFRMLRVGLVCFDPLKPPQPVPGALPRALLVSDWVRLSSRDAILQYIISDSFDPATTVVLESPPPLQTVSEASPLGSVRVEAITTDSMRLRVESNRPALLVLTENFSTGWRVVPVEPGQQEYRVVPANWAHMAIPLERGKHLLRLEYSPGGLRIGRWISILSLLGLAAAAVLLMRRRPRFR